MGRLRTSHPDEGELLRFADGELSAREEKKIRRHLASCWECRTEIDELEKTVGECVRYRQKVLKEGLPEPPAPWFDIYRGFAKADEELAQRSWAARWWEALRAGAAQPRRWSAAAAMVVIALVIVDQLRNTPSVRAAELLGKATVAAEARGDAPRWVEIRTGETSLKRMIDGDGGARQAALSPDETGMMAALRARFQAARYNWQDPLSAATFAAWRNTLAEKRDEVATVTGPARSKRYRIRTTTDSSELREATLELTVDQLRPVASRLRFRDDQQVEISALAEAPAVEPLAAVAVARPPRAPAPVAAAPPAEIVRPATPGEELEVLAVLHQLGADLGEPVEVARDGSRVVVRGVGVTPSLGQRIKRELRDYPNVVVQFSEPEPAPVTETGGTTEEVEPAGAAAQIQAELERQLGGRAPYDQFADQVLGLTDSLMARVHALRRLAERFDPDTEAQLSAEERQTLADLRREHAGVVADLSGQLDGALHPLLSAAGAAEPTEDNISLHGADWQAATAEIFQNARVAESLLAVILGGAATDTPPDELPSQALMSVVKLRVMAAEYARLP